MYIEISMPNVHACTYYKHDYVSNEYTLCYINFWIRCFSYLTVIYANVCQIFKQNVTEANIVPPDPLGSTVYMSVCNIAYYSHK